MKTTYRTKQQQDLLLYLRSTIGEHHTVSQIRDYFSQSDRPIGTATIYRQLERLGEEGSVRKYMLETGDSACYEYVEHDHSCSSHFHCKCVKCGKLIHMDCDELQEIREHLQKEHGFIWDSGRTVFYGICADCQEQEI